MTSDSSSLPQGAGLFERAARHFVARYWPAELLEHVVTGDEPDWHKRALRRTVHVARSLQAFSDSAPLVSQTHFLRHLMVLPLAGPVAAAMPSYEGMEFIVVGEQFVDLLKFHYQVTAGFRMAEYLAQTGALPEPLSQCRAQIYWNGLAWIHDWFRCNGGSVPDLSRHVVSALSLGLDSDALMQALLFMVLHECGHFALGHIAEGPNNEGVAAFRQMSEGLLSEEQEQELAADAWAIRAMHWPNAGWQCTAIARLFVLFGVAHATLGTRSPEHPYLHDRCAHLVAVLEQHGIAVPADTQRLPDVIAQEYDYRKHRTGSTTAPSRDERLSLLIGYLDAVSRQFEVAGGDAALLSWMRAHRVITRPW